MRRQWSQLRHAMRARHATSNPIGQAWIVMVAILLSLKGSKVRASRLALPIRLCERWFWLGDLSELRVVEEIFVRRIYDTTALPQSARIILDLGANAGVASLCFLRRYPDAQVLAYEADPQVARRAMRNLHDLPVEVRIHAVSDRAEPVRLHRAIGRSWSTGVYWPGGDEFTVAGETLDRIIGEQRIDILKIDIEGSEYAAIKACTRLSQVELIFGEFHPIEGVTGNDFFELLDGFDLLAGGGPEKGGFVARRKRDHRGEPTSSEKAPQKPRDRPLRSEAAEWKSARR